MGILRTSYGKEVLYNHAHNGGDKMNIGDLVTWKVDAACGDIDYGVVIGVARKVGRTIDLLWVKFLTGHRSHRKKTLCNIDHLILIKDIK
tara:strand:- start:164 stop:433 length:270 start_codon:yes stop_codon:yes gene_type:complete